MNNIHSKSYIPLSHKSLIAGADISAWRFIGIDGEPCQLGTQIAGIPEDNAELGNEFSVVSLGSCIVLSAGAIFKGDRVISDVNGEAISIGSANWSNTVLKSVDETKVSDITLVDDSDLKIDIRASETITTRFVLSAENLKAATQSIKLNLNLPIGATVVATVDGGQQIDFSSPATVSLTTTQKKDIIIEAVITNSTTAGQVALQWAQNTSDASGIKILKGSKITANPEGLYTANSVIAEETVSSGDYLRVNL